MYFYSWYNVPVMLKNTKFLKSSFLCSILNEYSEDLYYEEPCYSNCLLGERNSWEFPLYLQASLKLTSWGGGAGSKRGDIRCAIGFFFGNASISILLILVFQFYFSVLLFTGGGSPSTETFFRGGLWVRPWRLETSMRRSCFLAQGGTFWCCPRRRPPPQGPPVCDALSTPRSLPARAVVGTPWEVVASIHRTAVRWMAFLYVFSSCNELFFKQAVPFFL